VWSKDLWRAYAALDGRIWVMAGVRAVNTMGLSLVMAFMAIYLVDGRGLSATLYGTIFLIANLVQSLTQGYAGELSDRIGRLRVITAALGTRAFVIAGLGFAVLHDADIVTIGAILVVSSALRGCFDPVAYAFVADVAAPDQRVAAFGLQRMGTNLGWAIGPALGGFLALSVPYGEVFFCAAGALIVSAIATTRVTAVHVAGDADEPTSVSLREAFAEALGRPDVTVFLIGTLLVAVTHVQLFSTLSIFAASELHLDNGEIGLLYTVNGIAVLLLQIPAVALIERVGVGRSLIVAPLVYAGGFVLFGAAEGFVLAAVAVFAITVGEVVLAPAHQTAAAELGDPSRMGRAFGLLGTMKMLGVAVAPLIGGVIYDHLRDQHVVMWSVLALIPLVLTATFVALAGIRARYVTRPDPAR
jgi:MFS family permease